MHTRYPYVFYGGVRSLRSPRWAASLGLSRSRDALESHPLPAGGRDFNPAPREGSARSRIFLCSPRTQAWTVSAQERYLILFPFPPPFPPLLARNYLRDWDRFGSGVPLLKCSWTFANRLGGSGSRLKLDTEAVIALCSHKRSWCGLGGCSQRSGLASNTYVHTVCPRTVVKGGQCVGLLWEDCPKAFWMLSVLI